MTTGLGIDAATDDSPLSVKIETPRLTPNCALMRYPALISNRPPPSTPWAVLMMAVSP
jgi:hypothetical protein